MGDCTLGEAIQAANSNAPVDACPPGNSSDLIVLDADLTRQREVVKAFFTASRGGDFDALLAVLDPDVVVRADHAAVAVGAANEVWRALAVAKQLSGRARSAQLALVNGALGVVVAPRGRLIMVLGFTITRGKIVEVDVVGDPKRLRQLHMAVLSG